MHIRIILGIKFHLKQTILISCTKFAQKGCFLPKQKSEYRHWILYIRISLITEFQLKLLILIFWTKFVLKGYFQSKTRKVNIAI